MHHKQLKIALYHYYYDIVCTINHGMEYLQYTYIIDYT